MPQDTRESIEPLAKHSLNRHNLKPSLDHTTWPTLSIQTLKHGETLWKSASHQLERVDLTIRHQWPPDFSRTDFGQTGLHFALGA